MYCVVMLCKIKKTENGTSGCAFYVWNHDEKQLPAPRNPVYPECQSKPSIFSADPQLGQQQVDSGSTFSSSPPPIPQLISL